MQGQYEETSLSGVKIKHSAKAFFIFSMLGILTFHIRKSVFQQHFPYFPRIDVMFCNKLCYRKLDNQSIWAYS